MDVIIIKDQYGKYQIQKQLQDIKDRMIKHFLMQYEMFVIFQKLVNHYQIKMKQHIHIGKEHFHHILIIKYNIMIGH